MESFPRFYQPSSSQIATISSFCYSWVCSILALTFQYLLNLMEREISDPVFHLQPLMVFIWLLVFLMSIDILLVSLFSSNAWWSVLSIVLTTQFHVEATNLKLSDLSQFWRDLYRIYLFNVVLNEAGLWFLFRCWRNASQLHIFVHQRFSDFGVAIWTNLLW